LRNEKECNGDLDYLSDALTLVCSVRSDKYRNIIKKIVTFFTMSTQTIHKESTSMKGIEWDAVQRKAVAFSFLATGLGTAMILSFGTFLVN